MRNNIFSLVMAGVCLVTSSCRVDNYNPPSATIFGAVTDAEGQPVQSDVSGQGVKIIYVENGNFSSPSTQSINLKTDGSFEKGLIFPGSYKVTIRDANFPNVDTLKTFTVSPGRNELKFNVQPYVKITNVNVEKNGNSIVAKFNLKTAGNNVTRVERVQLFTYIDKSVGFGAQFGIQPANSNVLVLNKAPGLNEQFTLQIDLSQQGNTLSKYPTATKFWFRVGALVLKADATAGSNPKWNYSEPIQLAIN